jgi:hypothetical protein
MHHSVGGKPDLKFANGGQTVGEVDPARMYTYAASPTDVLEPGSEEAGQLAAVVHFVGRNLRREESANAEAAEVARPHLKSPDAAEVDVDV